MSGWAPVLLAVGLLVVSFLIWRLWRECGEVDRLRFRVQALEGRLAGLGVVVEYGEDWVMSRRPLTAGLKQCEINARKTHCPSGHPLSGENLVIKKDGRGREMRACRQCIRAANRRAAAARRQGQGEEGGG